VKNEPRLVLITSNFTSIAIPVVDQLAADGFRIVGILYEERGSVNHVRRFGVAWWRIWLKNWGHYKLIAPFICERFTSFRRRRKRQVQAELAKAGGQPLNDLNSVFDLAERHKIPLQVVEDINGQRSRAFLKSLNPDLGLSIASRILKPPIYQIPRLGVINLHSCKLPEFRGMSPVGFRETLAGFDRAYLYIHFIEVALDTGPIVQEATLDLLTYNYDCDLLEQASIELAKQMFKDAIPKVARGERGKQQVERSYRTVTSPTKAERLKFYEARNRLINGTQKS